MTDSTGIPLQTTGGGSASAFPFYISVKVGTQLAPLLSRGAARMESPFGSPLDHGLTGWRLGRRLLGEAMIREEGYETRVTLGRGRSICSNWSRSSGGPAQSASIHGQLLQEEKKHNGRDQVAGRGEGFHKIPTVVRRTGK